MEILAEKKIYFFFSFGMRFNRCFESEIKII